MSWPRLRPWQHGRYRPGPPGYQVLTGLLLDSTDGRLEITGFDYEVSTRADVPGA